MKKILLLATGGTIACKQTAEGLAPALSAQELLSFLPGEPFCEIDTLPLMNLDSTNIRPAHWLQMAAAIQRSYAGYDGFVLCHGTDTLAYTAAALSYLIQNSPKPIVLTGAQQPIDAENTDARTNLADSLRYACAGEGGVYIVFGSHVILGTRARKVRTKSYNAFTSLNFPDVACVRGEKIFRYIPGTAQGEPVFYDTLNERVCLLKLTPGMDAGAFAVMGALCDGLIIESYGVGGVPNMYLPALDVLLAQGKIVVMATQVPQEGSDLSVYQVGQHLKTQYHLPETHDMTLEASVTKLMWALGQTRDADALRRLFYKTIHNDILL